MNVSKLERAIEEATRFLKRAGDVKREATETIGDHIVCGPKETGALRRASMDLTRALAELRKPPA